MTITVTTTSTDISLARLIPSPRNVRRTGAKAGIESLAASIAAHGLLQSLVVRPQVGNDGQPTDRYEVVAGGRRLAALKLLAKQKRIGDTVARFTALPPALAVSPGTTDNETDATTIRTAFHEDGELSAGIEFRRLFPGVTDPAKARECVRMIAGWTSRPPAPVNVVKFSKPAGALRFINL